MWNLKNDIKKIHYAIRGSEVRTALTEAMMHIDKALVTLIMCQIIQGVAIILVAIKSL